MTAPYLQGSASMPLSSRLRARGIQTDPRGEVRGGHRSIIDFSTLGDSIASGSAVDNLVVGGADATLVGMAASSIAANKGIKKTSTSVVYLALGAEFNLRNPVYGGEPSIVVSAWMKHDDLATNILAAFGYSNGAGSNCQYQWAVTTGGSGNIRAVVNGVSIYTTLTVGTAYMHTLYFRRTAAGAYEVQVYIGATRIGTISGQTYPFKDPTVGGGSPTPAFGWAAGFSSGYLGTLHRSQVFQVDPVTFDIAEWLAAEMALNSAIFAA